MILLFLFEREPMMLAFLVRCLAVGVEFMHTLITAIGQQFQSGRQRQAALLEKSKVVRPSSACDHAQNLLRAIVNHDLPFLGVAFLLTRVEPALFFWGRSMRCSLASTTITIRSKEPSCNAFLPGKWNL